EARASAQREIDPEAGAAERAVGHRDIAAVGARDGARDGQPEAGAAFVPRAHGAASKKRLEDGVPLRFRNAFTCVVHVDSGTAFALVDVDRYDRPLRRMANAVLDQVSQQALELERAALDRCVAAVDSYGDAARG